jgi:hypothetical protein
MANPRARYAITILRQPHRCIAQVDCYIAVLKAFYRLDDKFLPRLSQHKDRKLRLVARRLEDLHHDYERRPEFVTQHAQPILDGWWVWRNVSAERVRRNIIWACAFAGKEFGKDVIIDYPSWKLTNQSSPDGIIASLLALKSVGA